MQLPVAHAHTITSGTPTQHPHKYGLSCVYILLTLYAFFFLFTILCNNNTCIHVEKKYPKTINKYGTFINNNSSGKTCIAHWLERNQMTKTNVHDLANSYKYLCHKWPRDNVWFVAITMRSFPHAWLITGFVTRVTHGCHKWSRNYLPFRSTLVHFPFLVEFVLLNL